MFRALTYEIKNVSSLGDLVDLKSARVLLWRDFCAGDNRTPPYLISDL